LPRACSITHFKKYPYDQKRKAKEAGFFGLSFLHFLLPIVFDCQLAVAHSFGKTSLDVHAPKNQAAIRLHLSVSEDNFTLDADQQKRFNSLHAAR
jgi:hypothetical protein